MSDASPTVSLLKSLPYIGALPESALKLLLDKSQVVGFKSGDVIFRKGDPGDVLLIVLRGRIKIFNTTTAARELVLNFLGPGDVTGEVSVLAGGERMADAVATEATGVLKLQRRDVLPALTASPEAMLVIIQQLCHKLRAAGEIAAESQLTMEQRCASGLLRLARQYGQPTTDGILINLTVPQRDLGAYFGLSRENTSRQLAAMKQEGIIRMGGGRIVIKDMTAMEALALKEQS